MNADPPIKFRGVWEQDTDVIVRREGNRLRIELSCDQLGGVTHYIYLDPMQIARDIENSEPLETSDATLSKHGELLSLRISRALTMLGSDFTAFTQDRAAAILRGEE